MDETKTLLALSDDDWTNLDAELKDKLHLAISSLSEDLTDLKKKLDSSEKEDELKKLQDKIEELTKDNDQHIALLTEVQESDVSRGNLLMKKDDEIKEFQQTIGHLSSVQNELSAAVETTEQERDEMKNILSKKNEELELIRQDRDKIRSEWEEYQKDRLSLRFKVEEIQTKEFSFKQHEERWNQDKSHLEEMISWWKQQANEKSELVINIRKELSSRVLQLEGDLEVKTIELNRYRDTCESLKKSVEDLTSQSEATIDQLKQSNEGRAQMEELFRNELDAQKKLTDLYKTSLNELESRDYNYATAVEELQKIVKRASEDYVALQQESEEALLEMKQQLDEKTDSLEAARRELVDANALIQRYRDEGLTESEVERMAPAAAAASRLLKRGKTLTQIYSEYVEMYNALETKKLENKHLQESMQEMIGEIEAKAPLLRKQREEHELAQATIEDMKVRIEENEEYMKRVQSDYEQQTRRSTYLERAYKRGKIQVNDLSLQIQGLLKELERARGGYVVEDDEEKDDSMIGDLSHVSSTSDSGRRIVQSEDVIEAGLVKVSGIRAMQEQNLKLREVVRDLTEMCEEQEKSLQKDKTAELRNQLADLKCELENIQLLEKRHKNMLEMVIRQRDMYKILLQHHDISLRDELGSDAELSQHDESSGKLDQMAGSPTKASPQQAANRGDLTPEMAQKLETSRQALLELEEEFKTYRENRQEHEKIQDGTIEKLRAENNDLRLKTSRLTSKLEHANEKLKTLDVNVTSYRKEINILREMNSKYTTSVAKFERDAEHLRAELKAKVERASQMEVRCEHLRVENERLRLLSQQTQSELDNLRLQRNTQEMLLSNLQSIENRLEHRDNETRIALTNQIGTLQRECETLRCRLEREKQAMSDHAANWNKEMSVLREQLKTETAGHAATMERLALTEKQVNTLQLSKQSAMWEIQTLRKAQLESADSGIDKRRSIGEIGNSTDSEISHLNRKIKEHEAQKEDLTAQIARLTKQVDEYKAIAEGSECQLEEQRKVMKNLEEQLSANIAAEREMISSLKAEVEKLKLEKMDVVDEKEKIERKNMEEVESLRSELEESSQRLSDAVAATEAATKEAAAAVAEKEKAVSGVREEIEARDTLVREAAAKYQSELVLHAEDVRQMTALRQEVENLSGERTKWKKESEAAVVENAKRTRELLARESELENEKRDFTARYEEMRKQNNSLQEQVEKFGSQILSLKKALEETSSSGDSATPARVSEDLKTSEDLLQVVRYLRREKEIAETQGERLHVENARLQQKMEALQRELAVVREKLLDECERNKAELASAKHHAGLMAQMEQLNLLTESNRLMRQERINVENELRQSQERLHGLERVVDPLKEELEAVRTDKANLETAQISLREELECWKKRCTRLIERQEKLDPEVFKKACSDRDELKETLVTKEKELEKLKSEMVDIKENLIEKEKGLKNFEEQLATQRTTNKDLQVDIKTLTERVENQISIVAKKETAINQLREIARKYRSEAEALKKKDNENKLQEEIRNLKELNTRTKSQIPIFQNEIKALKAQLQELNGKRTATDKAIASLSQSIGCGDVSEEGAVFAKTRETVTSLRGELDSLRATNTQLNERLTTLSSEMDSGNEERSELNLRSRMVEAQMQKLTKENAELRKMVKHLKQTLDMHKPTQQPQIQQSSHSAAGDLPSVPQSGSSTAGGVGGSEEKQPPASATSPPISAAATVVRVQPTVSSSNGTTAPSAAAPSVATSEFGGHPGAASVVSTASVVSAAVPPQQSRQMAEIRPMPSVACVMPTPAPAEQQPPAIGANIEVPQVAAAVVQQQPQSQTQNLQMSSVVSITVSQPMNVAQSTEIVEHQAPHQQHVVPAPVRVEAMAAEAGPSGVEVAPTSSDQVGPVAPLGPRAAKRRADEVAPAQVFDYFGSAKRLRGAVSSTTSSAAPVEPAMAPPATSPPQPPQQPQQEVSPQPRLHEEAETGEAAAFAEADEAPLADEMPSESGDAESAAREDEAAAGPGVEETVEEEEEEVEEQPMEEEEGEEEEEEEHMAEEEEVEEEGQNEETGAEEMVADSELVSENENFPASAADEEKMEEGATSSQDNQEIEEEEEEEEEVPPEEVEEEEEEESEGAIEVRDEEFEGEIGEEEFDEEKEEEEDIEDDVEGSESGLEDFVNDGLEEVEEEGDEDLEDDEEIDDDEEEDEEEPEEDDIEDDVEDEEEEEEEEEDDRQRMRSQIIVQRRTSQAQPQSDVIELSSDESDGEAEPPEPPRDAAAGAAEEDAEGAPVPESSVGSEEKKPALPDSGRDADNDPMAVNAGPASSANQTAPTGGARREKIQPIVWRDEASHRMVPPSATPAAPPGPSPRGANWARRTPVGARNVPGPVRAPRLPPTHANRGATGGPMRGGRGSFPRRGHRMNQP